jgi:hypothetical protein
MLFKSKEIKKYISKFKEKWNNSPRKIKAILHRCCLNFFRTVASDHE